MKCSAINSMLVPCLLNACDLKDLDVTAKYVTAPRSYQDSLSGALA